jgi:hypothetical protein
VSILHNSDFLPSRPPKNRQFLQKSKVSSSVIASVDEDSSSSSEFSVILTKFPLPIEADAYVVIKLLPKGKRTAHPVFYIGSVVCQEKDRWKLQCMLRHKSSMNCFVYPVHEDIDIYPESDIIKVLKTPKVVKTVHHFSDDLSEFSHAMR